MLLNRFKRKLTFVIIPEADESVIRLSLSRAALCAIAVCAACILASSGFACLSYAKTSAALAMSRTELRGKNERLQQEMRQKNAAIEELRSQIYTILEQAAKVRAQVEDLKRLERDLKALAPHADSGKPAGAAADAAASGMAERGMGGPRVPVTAQEVRAIAANARASYDQLLQELSGLGSRLDQAKAELAAAHERSRRTPNHWPTVSRLITSPYGYRHDPFTGKLSFHRGIDIAGKLNDPVYAAASGIVHTVGSDRLHGNHVIVEHSEGLRTWYMHLNKATVKKGDAVDKGQMIGKLGTTGRSTGPHLHYEVIKSGKSIDPRTYLP